MSAKTNIEGQWVGDLSGAHTGIAILNIEKGNNGLGYLCIKQYDITAPAYRMDLPITLSENTLSGTTTGPLLFDHSQQQLVGLDRFKQQYPQFESLTFSSTYQIKAVVKGDVMEGTWTGEGENKGLFKLHRTADQSAEPAKLRFDSWKEFRNYIFEEVAKTPQMIFRGQWDGRKKLRTSFHRHNRYDLAKYLDQDFQTLRHQINSISRHFYDLSRPDDPPALLGLAQHHGFPTPMLDWTRSPFVAAYFAFSPPDQLDGQGEYSRIFIFNHQEWSKGAYRSQHMLDPMPSITVRILPAHNNPRAVPQQSVMMYSSLDDIEVFIRFIERVNNNKYLTTVDIAHSLRNEALQELRLMGITSASLFPDYEGVCRELKSLLFPS